MSSLLASLAVVWGVAVLYCLDRIMRAVEDEPEDREHIAGFVALPDEEWEEEVEVRAT